MSKQLTSNGIIALVNDQYGQQLKRIIYYAIPRAANTPEGVEDIYWLFMYRVPEIFSNLSPKNIEKYKGTIFAECKFFTKNRSRKWQTNNHKIMNYAYELHDEQYLDSRNTFQLGEDFINYEPSWKVDIEGLFKNLTKSDKHTYELYFVKNYSYRKIAKIKRWTVYRVSTSINRITIMAKKFLVNK